MKTIMCCEHPRALHRLPGERCEACEDQHEMQIEEQPVTSTAKIMRAS